MLDNTVIYRVITLGLQSTDCVTWAEALRSENILNRVLWIVENALNPLLIERVTNGFLLFTGSMFLFFIKSFCFEFSCEIIT